jgi:hypothetical protein
MRERAASDERETETVDSGIEININQPRGKLMEARFNYAKTAPEAYKAMLGLEQYLRECGLEESLLRLVKARASQINGCAYFGHTLEGLASNGGERTAAIFVGRLARVSFLHRS